MSLLCPESLSLSVSPSYQNLAPATVTWQKTSFENDKDIGRMTHASVIIDHYLVIIGGQKYMVAPEPANLVVFDLKKETCTQIEISGRYPRSLSLHSACYWKDNQIIVYGGQGGIGYAMIKEIGIITLSFTETSMKAEWREIETDSIPRRRHSAHIYKNQMIVLGGEGKSYQPLCDIHILYLDNFTWTQPKMPRQFPKGGLLDKASVLYGNEIYILGKTENYKILFLSLDLKTFSWKELPFPETQGSTLDFAPIQQHNGKIYLVENFSSEDDTKLDFKSFDISQGKWSDLPSKDQGQSKKTFFSLNIYKNRLLLYGGQTNTSYASNELWSFMLGGDSDKLNDVIQENIMKKFLREAPYFDVIFEVESEQIAAHKWWLCKKSKYFANMFSSGMMEAKSSKIVISDMKAAIFRGFLEYLYSEDVELDATLAKDLLTQADKYSVPELKGRCEQFLMNNIEPDNYVLLANLSELLEANKLRDAVRDSIAKNVNVLKTRKDFEEISMDMLRDVVVKVTVR